MKLPKANVKDFIGLFLTFTFTGAMVVLTWKAIPKENEQLLTYMLGQLSGFVAAVVAFHYVNKAGDHELEKQRADQTTKALDVALGGKVE